MSDSIIGRQEAVDDCAAYTKLRMLSLFGQTIILAAWLALERD